MNISPDPKGPLVALAFKVQIDKYIGRLVYIRVYSGTLKKGFFCKSDKWQERKVSRILQMMSNRKNDLDKIYAGDIGAIVGSRFLITGDTITDGNFEVLLSKMHFPDTVISMAIEPKTKADQENLDIALMRLEEKTLLSGAY